MMAEIDTAGLNAVFFQVRGEFDAYYPRIEPWAIRLTGQQVVIRAGILSLWLWMQPMNMVCNCAT